MAYDFSGTDQNLRTAENGVTGIDSIEYTMACWINPDVELSGADQDAFFSIGTAFAAGAGTKNLLQQLPNTSGFAVKFFANFDVGNGSWDTDSDLAINTWSHIAVSYDGIAANDPTIYLNGSSVAITEANTPSGSPIAAGDSISLGENMNSAQDWNGQGCEYAYWNRILTASEISDQATGGPGGVGKSALFHLSGLVFYARANTNGTEEIQGAHLTATGATAGAAHPNIIYPAANLRRDRQFSAGYSRGYLRGYSSR